MKYVIFIIFSLISNSSFAAPERFLCIAEKATGFSFDAGDWKSTEFTVDEKFILTKEPISEKKKEEFKGTVWRDVTTGYSIKEVGKSGLSGVISNWCALSHESLYCNDSIKTFGLNLKNLRFIVSSPWGYWNSTSDKKSDTPFLMIGRCSEF